MAFPTITTRDGSGQLVPQPSAGYVGVYGGISDTLTNTGRPLIPVAGDGNWIKGVVETGFTVKEGDIVGRVTSSGRFRLSAAASTDGSQVPVGVCSDVADMPAPTECMVVTRGTYAAAGLTLGAGHSLDSVAPALRDAGLFFVSIQPNPGTL